MLFVSDSNGKEIRLGQLKPDARTTRATRYTIPDAIESVPNVRDPTAITDIIFQVGLNDLRKGCSPKVVEES